MSQTGDSLNLTSLPIQTKVLTSFGNAVRHRYEVWKTLGATLAMD